MPDATEATRDSWVPTIPPWLRTIGVSIITAAVIGIPAIAVTWGSWEARAEAEARRLDDHAERMSAAIKEAAERRDMTAARVGALEVRQAEQGARFEALQRGQDEIKESLRRLETRLGTRRRGDD